MEIVNNPNVSFSSFLFQQLHSDNGKAHPEAVNGGVVLRVGVSDRMAKAINDFFKRSTTIRTKREQH